MKFRAGTVTGPSLDFFPDQWLSTRYQRLGGPSAWGKPPCFITFPLRRLSSLRTHSPAPQNGGDESKDDHCWVAAAAFDQTVL